MGGKTKGMAPLSSPSAMLLGRNASDNSQIALTIPGGQIQKATFGIVLSRAKKHVIAGNIKKPVPPEADWVGGTNHIRANGTAVIMRFDDALEGLLYLALEIEDRRGRGDENVQHGLLDHVMGILGLRKDNNTI